MRLVRLGPHFARNKRQEPIGGAAEKNGVQVGAEGRDSTDNAVQVGAESHDTELHSTDVV